MTGQILVGTYDYRLVVLSVLIAILASYAALDLGGRVTASRRWTQIAWLFGGGLAMGIGIWSMHYVAMFAFSLPIPMQYDWPTTLLSLLAGVVASLAALFIASRRNMGFMRGFGGSVFMGGAIVALHYVAMDSMRLRAIFDYSSTLVTLSVLIAVAGSWIALRFTFFFRDERSGRWKRKAASSVAMGVAIASMHYTAMAAATFRTSPSPPDLSHAVSITTLAVAGMSGVPSIVLMLTIFTCLIDRLQGQKAQLTTLTGQLLQSQDEERRRLARELHDSLGQKLAALGMNLGVLEESAGAIDARAKRALDESLALTRESIREIRTLAYLLHPPELDELGLLDAVNDYVAGFVQRSGIAIDLKLPPDLGRLSREVELALFRVLQESLNNIHRHSGATRASVEISHSPSAIRMKIADAGPGVQEDTWHPDRNAPTTPGVGIAGMRERVAQLGGRLEIRSATTGTTLEVFIPLHAS